MLINNKKRTYYQRRIMFSLSRYLPIFCTVIQPAFSFEGAYFSGEMSDKQVCRPGLAPTPAYCHLDKRPLVEVDSPQPFHPYLSKEDVLVPAELLHICG